MHYISTSNVFPFQLLLIKCLPSFGIISLFNLSHPNECVLVVHYDFLCIFSLAIHISCFHSICSNFCPFFKNRLFFLLVGYRSSSFSLNTSLMSYIYYFLPVFAFPLHFLQDVIWRAEVFNFNKAYFFFFYILCFGDPI